MIAVVESENASEGNHHLAREGMSMAVELRLDLDLGLESSISAYDVCEKLGMLVRFVDINMEGIYLPYARPRILISSHRPLGRRHFSCAHELGHHLFSHGATLDEAQVESDKYDGRHPNEILVDAFAGHFLMPVIGIRQAFVRRGVNAREAKPEHILSIATEFGVTYEALLTHLAIALKDISVGQLKALLQARSEFRRSLLGDEANKEIFLVDGCFGSKTLDVEINSLIVAPKGTVTANSGMIALSEGLYGTTFRATQRGTANLRGSQLSDGLTIRVAPERFVGLARFRHLQEIE